MDTSDTDKKIGDISKNTTKYQDKRKETYNKYAIKINGYIDSLETVINKAITSGSSANAWTEIQINKILKNIEDTLNSMTKSINSITEQARNWYDDAMNKMKATSIKSNYAKMGKECSDEMAQEMAKNIPHPSIDSILPEIHIDFNIPENTEVEEWKQIELKKIPLLE